MKSFESAFKEYTEKTKLRASERRDLRERIALYMEYHPRTRTTEAVPTPYGARRARFALPFSVTHFHISSRFVRTASAVCAIVIIAVPFVAQQSVPGDVLYLVKTDITEPIQAQFTSSPYEKIEFETRRMERRIAEARVLEKKGLLTDEVKVQIAETVKTHSDAVKGEIAQLRTQDAEGAAIAQIAFVSSLEVQSAVLGTEEAMVATATTMGATSSSDVALMMTAKVAAPSNPILSVVNDARDEIANTPEATLPSFDGLMARIERETTRAYELFATIKKSATPTEATDIERRLSDIGRRIDEAKALREADASTATQTVTDVLRQLQKLIHFMNDIDIRETVTLESLVPIVLSETERLTLVESERALLEALRADIVATLDADASLRTAEVDEEMARVDTLFTAIADAVAARDVVAVEGYVYEMHGRLNSLWILLQPEAPLPEIVGEVIIEPTPDTTPGTSTDTVSTSTSN